MLIALIFMGKSYQYNYTCISSFVMVLFRMFNLQLSDLHKVHIFLEGHKILRNLPLTLTVHTVISKGKILQNFVAFSEYMNFNCNTVHTIIR